MDKRQQLIDMICGSNDNWFQSTHISLGGEYHPIYIEYMNLLHRLRMLTEEYQQNNSLQIQFEFEQDGSLIQHKGELADKNRAMWQKFINNHRVNECQL